MLKKIFLLLFLSTNTQPLTFETTCAEENCTIRAFDDETLLGYIQLKACYISYVRVLDQFQKKGYGKALLKKAVAQSALHGCSEVALMPLSKLIPYYEKNGFTCSDNRCTQSV